LYGLGGFWRVLVSRRWKRRPMLREDRRLKRHELVEVSVELLVTDAALVGSEQPTLDECSDAVAGGQFPVCGLAVARLVEADLLVPVAGGGEAVVAVPTIGLEDRLAEPLVLVGKSWGRRSAARSPSACRR
jgi:hypothetical protein